MSEAYKKGFNDYCKQAGSWFGKAEKSKESLGDTVLNALSNMLINTYVGYSKKMQANTATNKPSISTNIISKLTNTPSIKQ